MRLRIATLNVWGLPWGLAPDLSRRIRAIGERLPRLDADLVALQEVWTRPAREELIGAGRGAGLRHEWPNRPGRPAGGLLVLSRLPIAAARFEAYRVRGLPERVWHSDYHWGKGFGELTIETPSGPIGLIDTHLHAQYAPDAADLYRAHRMAQVVQLAARVHERPGPLIAAGDFNLRQDQPHHGVLTGLTGLRDAAVELGQRQPTIIASNPYTRAHPCTDWRIDYVLLRDGAGRALRPRSIQRIFDEVLEIGGRAGAYSDHAGLLVEIAVDPGNGKAPAPDAHALAAAHRMLQEGRADATRRRQQRRLVALSGVAAAGVALAAARRRAYTRRRLLRGLLGAGGVLALGTSLGAGALAEFAAAEEAGAFDDVIRRLEAMRGTRTARVIPLPAGGVE